MAFVAKDILAVSRRVAAALAAGRRQSDLASASGLSAATVCRRVKLLSLVPAMAAALEPGRVSARTLEAVAGWPRAVQERAARRVAEVVRKSGRLTRSDAAAVFDATARAVRRASWVFDGERGAARFARCARCAECSGNQPDLFDAAGGASAFGADERGVCLAPRCFRRFEAAARRERVEAEIARTSGGRGADGVVEVDGRRRKTARALRRRPGATWAYVAWDEARHAASVRWGRAPA